MSFLTPAAFALALLLPLIVIMYLLKLRRTEQVVSSVYLWRRMVRDVEANAPWQRLRRNLLMFLQLLFLILLILALAQPFTWMQGASGQAVILVVDVSASMGATDLSPNRLEAAKDQARQIVDGLPDDARVTLIAASNQADVLASSSQDLRRVYQAIDDLQLSNSGSDLTPALGLAAAISARQPDTQIVILSDGRVTLPERLALKGEVVYLPTGLSGENQAISLLSLQPEPGGETSSAFAQVTNYGSEVATRRLEFYAGNQLLDAFDVSLEAGEQKAVVASGLPAGLPWIEARLAGEDTLPLDNRAWAVLETAPPLAVTLVSDGNLFLETALGLLPGVELTTVRPGDFESGEQPGETGGDTSPAAASTPSLTIFDGYVPITATMPAGSLLFIAPLRSTAFFSVTGSLTQPALQIVDAQNPLLANVSLSDVHVLDSTRISLPDWASELVRGDMEDGTSAPLLAAGQLNGQRVSILAFDLRRSDLPLQVAFPLLLSNLVEWSAPGRGSLLPPLVAPGEAVPLSLVADSVSIQRPDGSRVEVDLQGGRGAFGDTTQLGLYQVEWAGQGQGTASGQGTTSQGFFAVNLFSPQESNVNPVQSLALPGSSGQGDQQAANQARREWWRPLAFAALAFLVAEWLVYHRASLQRVISWLRSKWPKVSRPTPG